ncbi:(-)-germacrene D synthase-like [Pyrus ussuriensis x Pyrus communis]|uniref:(-)-germacrene D synthase-like n=1 Tax=Pyrus ussuriensis x Pyrus communis TaxID=2448454 RepID=A0A5N5HRU3_9ROSA|nr:(-)-germacrene D synthase-like [Pyrus ussuriensis x Pyrus communis]
MSSVEVPLSQSSNPNDTFDVHWSKPSATFSPSIWGDHFLSYASLDVDAELEQHVQELKEEVRRMLTTSPENVSQKLNLIDDIQRLGVSYHFGNEIEESLQKIHKSSYDLDDLYTAALRFRLLRQQGYNISCDLFNKFKDGDGKFKESLVDDVVGLLSLYEATHLRIHGEEILDEALIFTTTNLESATFRLSPPLAKAVTHALNQPLRKGLPRVEARYYLSVYQELRESPNKTLLTFAKLDFNRLQRVHQKELSEITRWDVSAMNQLPKYMKICYRALLDVYSEIHEKLPHDGKLYRIHHAREAMKKQVRAYFDEAKLFHQKHMPSLDEYMSVSLVTCGYQLLITTSFLGMEEATIDSFDWLLTSPLAVKAATIVCRLMDDIAEHKFEQDKEHFIGVVNCYTKKYGTTEEEAITELQRQVNNAWKDINEACLHPTAVPMALLIRILNFARTMDVVYKHEDGYTNANGMIKDLIVSTLVEPVAL